ncbi:hypothetical protein OC834_002876 [Tilletia horrida]|nr:hypothetical protein OC834_002876 [Tilletia horrida]
MQPTKVSLSSRGDASDGWDARQVPVDARWTDKETLDRIPASPALRAALDELFPLLSTSNEYVRIGVLVVEDMMICTAPVKKMQAFSDHYCLCIVRFWTKVARLQLQLEHEGEDTRDVPGTQTETLLAHIRGKMRACRLVANVHAQQPIGTRTHYVNETRQLLLGELRALKNALKFAERRLLLSSRTVRLAAADELERDRLDATLEPPLMIKQPVLDQLQYIHDCTGDQEAAELVDLSVCLDVRLFLQALRFDRDGETDEDAMHTDDADVGLVLQAEAVCSLDSDTMTFSNQGKLVQWRTRAKDRLQRALNRLSTDKLGPRYLQVIIISLLQLSWYEDTLQAISLLAAICRARLQAEPNLCNGLNLGSVLGAYVLLAVHHAGIIQASHSRSSDPHQQKTRTLLILQAVRGAEDALRHLDAAAKMRGPTVASPPGLEHASILSSQLHYAAATALYTVAKESTDSLKQASILRQAAVSGKQALILLHAHAPPGSSQEQALYLRARTRDLLARIWHDTACHVVARLSSEHPGHGQDDSMDVDGAEDEFDYKYRQTCKHLTVAYADMQDFEAEAWDQLLEMNSILYSLPRATQLVWSGSAHLATDPKRAGQIFDQAATFFMPFEGVSLTWPRSVRQWASVAYVFGAPYSRRTSDLKRSEWLYSKAVRVCKRGLQGLPLGSGSGSPSSAAALMDRLLLEGAWVSAEVENYAWALDQAKRAEINMRPRMNEPDAPTRAQLAMAIAVQGFAQWMLGSTKTATRLLQDSVAMFEEAGASRERMTGRQDIGYLCALCWLGGSRSSGNFDAADAGEEHTLSNSKPDEDCRDAVRLLRMYLAWPGSDAKSCQTLREQHLPHLLVILAAVDFGQGRTQDALTALDEAWSISPAELAPSTAKTCALLRSHVLQATEQAEAAAVWVGKADAIEAKGFLDALGLR